MFNWRELLQSKKFKVMTVSVIGVILMALAQEGTIDQDTIQKVVNLVMVYLGAQGVADAGKYFSNSE